MKPPTRGGNLKFRQPCRRRGIHCFCVSPTPWYALIELSDRLDTFEFLSRESVKERDFLSMVAQVLHTVAHVHSMSITHRDIMLENSVVPKRPASSPVKHELKCKLIDFQLAHCDLDGKKITTFLRTKQYQPPETLLRVPDMDLRPKDVWAIGMLVYAALTNTYPFTSQHFEKWRLQIRTPFDEHAWSRVAQTTWTAVKSVLHYNPAWRPSTVRACQFFGPASSFQLVTCRRSRAMLGCSLYRKNSLRISIEQT
ncbi:Death-associated protein kinase 3 [Porphyridium purpureum]|uniref:Death-associated protein kinase 3 n=1 Tax=Porphyridium purpureum TaxID=35688 RepID=A0A5J4YZE1_PORPP|nr:Death-associated protein kinase 3 [Porphyridium purpureum]|eukprot:POR1157..scf209_3